MRFPLLMLCGLLVGCGSESPKFDKSVEYSVESLADELAFRARDLKSSPVIAPDGKPLASDDLVKKRTQATTKEAPELSVDSLIDDIATKAETIPGKSRADVLNAVIPKIEADTKLSAPLKAEILAKLKALAGA